MKLREEDWIKTFMFMFQNIINGDKKVFILGIVERLQLSKDYSTTLI